MNKATTIAIVVVIIIIGAYLIYHSSKPGVTEQNNVSTDTGSVASSSSTSTTTEATATQAVAGNFVWTFKGVPVSDPTAPPQTAVILTTSQKTYPVGTYTGTCSDIKSSSWPLLQNEQGGVICWFAGAGEEIGIFQESQGLVVKTGDLDEGSAESAGVRGNFKTLFQL